MKLLKYVAIVIFSLYLIHSCTTKKQDSAYQQLKKNSFSFPEWSKASYYHLKFKVPSLFKNNYFSDYTYTNSGYIRSVPDIGIHFSVEKIYGDILEDIMYDYADFEGLDEEEMSDVDSLDALHFMVVDKRIKSLEYYDFSILNTKQTNLKYPTFIQTVHGQQNLYSEEMYYHIATIRKEDEFYVIQFITNEEMSAYLYDDFIKILESIY
jgi:hypothetical protein